MPPWCALEINALQRASTIVVQKSIKEGFGLTVTEALWKGKPTIGGAVGGIPNQIIHKLTGMLVHSVEGCAYQIRYLLTHPGVRRATGPERPRARQRKFPDHHQCTALAAAAEDSAAGAGGVNARNYSYRAVPA